MIRRGDNAENLHDGAHLVLCTCDVKKMQFWGGGGGGTDQRSHLCRRSFPFATGVFTHHRSTARLVRQRDSPRAAVAATRGRSSLPCRLHQLRELLKKERAILNGQARYLRCPATCVVESRLLSKCALPLWEFHASQHNNFIVVLHHPLTERPAGIVKHKVVSVFDHVLERRSCRCHLGLVYASDQKKNGGARGAFYTPYPLFVHTSTRRRQYA